MRYYYDFWADCEVRTLSVQFYVHVSGVVLLNVESLEWLMLLPE